MSPEEVGTGAGAIGLVAGSLITGIGVVIVNIIKAKGEVSANNNATVLKQQQEYQQLLRKDLDDCKAEIKELREAADQANENYLQCKQEHQETMARYDRAMNRIEALKDTLDRNGIQVRPWDPNGSSEHTPLPSQGEERRKKDTGRQDGPDRRSNKDRRNP